MKKRRIGFGGPRKTASKRSSIEQPLNIQGFTLDGRGVARDQGKTVFVNGAIPGDLVEVKLTKTDKRFDEAEISSILEPSKERIEPQCEYFGRCGGCDLQQTSPDVALQWKKQELLNQLQRHAKVEPEHLDTDLTSSRNWNYRRTARIGINQRETGELLIGFRRRGSHKLIDIDQCPILTPRLNQFIEQLRQLLTAEERVKHITQLLISEGRETLTAELRSVRPLNPTLEEGLIQLAKQHQTELTLDQGKTGKHTLYKPATDTTCLIDSDIELSFTASDFLQVNADVNEKLIRRVIEWFAPTEGDCVLDLFSGLGNFSLPLAKRVAQVTAVEGSREMVNRCQQNAVNNQLNNVLAQIADLSKADTDMHWFKQDYSLVLLDPPRTGAAALVANISQLKPRALIYIACDPASLVRDAKTLKEQGYKMNRFCVADMFPQTHHIESLALFTPA